MNKTIFLKELKERIEQEFPGYEVRFWEDGFLPTNADEKSFVEATNAKYAREESCRLIGDFITVTKGELTTRMSLEYVSAFSDGAEKNWEKVMDMVRNMISNMASFKDGEKLNNLKDFGFAKSMFFIRLINYSDHRLELKNTVYERIGDIAKVLYFRLSDDGKNLNSTKVPRDLLGVWKVPEKEIWDAAMLNTFSAAMPRIYKTPQECYKPPYQLGAFLGREFSLPVFPAPTLTTTRQVNGAIAIFYPGVAERIAELYESDFLVAFTSIHEMRIHKIGTTSPREVLGHLKQVNKVFNGSNGELLTRKVYRYFRDKKELVMLEL